MTTRALPAIRDTKTNHKWQTRAAVEWIATQMDTYGVIGMAVQAITGTGKTRAAILAMKIWFEDYKQLARVVVVVPTEALLKQWHGIITAHYIANVSKQGGGSRYDGFAPIVVVIQASLKRIENHKNLSGKKTLYILDEAHRAGAKGTLTRLKRIRKNQNMQGCLAISATLRRSDGNCIMDITGYDGYNEEGDRQAHIRYGYADAVADNVIPPFRIHVYETTDSDLTWDEADELKSLNKQIAIAYGECKNNHEINASNLFHHTMNGYSEVERYRSLTRKRKRVLNNLTVRYDIAHDRMIEEVGKGVLFHETIEGVERIANAAVEAGLDKPYIYHSGETPDDWDNITVAEIKKYKEYARNRKKILAKWVDPRTEDGVLLTVKALKEGLDVPEMDWLMMLSHPNNATPLIQATGRALRGNKNADGVWTNLHGVVIDEDNPKNIYIVVQAGTTDAHCIGNMQKEGNIPTERFVHYRRQGGLWTPITPIKAATNGYDPNEFDIVSIVFDPNEFDTTTTPALEFNALTGEMQPAVSAHQTGGIKQ